MAPILRAVMASLSMSEVELGVDVEDVAVPSHRIVNGRVSHRTLVEVDPLRVDAEPALPDRVVVRAGPHLPRVAVDPADRRPAEVALERLRHDHPGRLHLEA